MPKRQGLSRPAINESISDAVTSSVNRTRRRGEQMGGRFGKGRRTAVQNVRKTTNDLKAGVNEAAAPYFKRRR